MVVVAKLNVAAESPSIRIPSDRHAAGAGDGDGAAVEGVRSVDIVETDGGGATRAGGAERAEGDVVGADVTPFQLTTCPVVVVTLLPRR